MPDFNSISSNIKNKFKVMVRGRGTYGNQSWKKGDYKWYQLIHDSNNLLHEDFMKYFKSKKDVKSVLEIGCGAGVYPIKHAELFENTEYTGIDISQENIDYCKKHSDLEFFAGDFIKMELEKEYDLVFSHAVVDHVYDIDEFIKNIISRTKKYAYINAYRGFFPDLKEHRMNWKDQDNCYYNDLSIPRTKEILKEMGISEKEYTIRKHDNGYEYDDVNGKKWFQTIIEITKSS